MGSGGSSSGSSQSTSDPWKGQQEYLKDIYKRAQAQSNEELDYYPDSTVAGESEWTGDYRSQVAQMAGEGSSLIGGAQQHNADLVGGKYLNNNPHREEAFNAASDDITRSYKRSMIPGIDSRFGGSGRFGSYAHQDEDLQGKRVLSQELGKLGKQFYFDDYQQERGAQDAAAQAAPGLAMADYDYLRPMGEVGQQSDVYSQQLLDDLVARFEFEQNEPWERISLYSQALGTSPVMSSQSSAENSSLNVGIMSCWAAAEHYGWYTTEWWDAAIWINILWPAQSPLGRAFLAWYKKHGQVLAKLIRENDDVRKATEPLFGWAREMGAKWR